MANLKEIRNRISSVSSTMQITSAMKMVSAAKLKRSQDAIIKLRPYASKLRYIMENVSGTLDLSENLFAEDRGHESVLIVAITSNRGLCGGFNSNVIKKVQSIIREDYNQSKVSVVCLGKKIKDAIKRTEYYFHHEAIAKHEDITASVSFERAGEVGQVLMHLFATKECDKIVLVYNRFVNAVTQTVEVEDFLPLSAPKNAISNTASDYIFEPEKEEIIEALIPKSLNTQLFKALLDSVAAEHAARMTAMHKATDNASELKKALKLSYNKARQAAITNEILEIVGGAEALNA